jgi:long-chain acyl-CoA synthetase
MKGVAVFSGYYKRPDKTAEAFDKDGWFCTGDVVQIYPNGSAKIIDRAKNIFKLS